MTRIAYYIAISRLFLFAMIKKFIFFYTFIVAYIGNYLFRQDLLQNNKQFFFYSPSPCLFSLFSFFLSLLQPLTQTSPFATYSFRLSFAHFSHVQSLSLSTTHNVSLLPRAAIKCQRQVADDGVPVPSHNARVQLHRDEYASRKIDGACDLGLLLLYVYTIDEIKLTIVACAKKVKRNNSNTILSCLYRKKN